MFNDVLSAVYNDIGILHEGHTSTGEVDRSDHSHVLRAFITLVLLFATPIGGITRSLMIPAHSLWSKISYLTLHSSFDSFNLRSPLPEWRRFRKDKAAASNSSNFTESNCNCPPDEDLADVDFVTMLLTMSRSSFDSPSGSESEAVTESEASDDGDTDGAREAY